MENQICNNCKNIIFSGNNIYYAYDNKYCTSICRIEYIKNNYIKSQYCTSVSCNNNKKYPKIKSFKNIQEFMAHDDENINSEVTDCTIYYNTAYENVCAYTLNYSIKIMFYIINSMYNQ